MNTTTYKSSTATQVSPASVSSERSNSVWARVITVLGKVFNLGEKSISSDLREAADRIESLARLQLGTTTAPGCSIAEFNEYTSMLTDTDRSIAADYLQGVSVTAISRNRHMSRREVLQSINSLHTLVHG